MWWGLGGVFLGGALPWLEAVVVIPAGIIAGLPPVATILTGALGNVLTVGIAAFGGEWLKDRWRAWRIRRRSSPEAATRGKAAKTNSAEKAAKRRTRIERLMNRGGLPLLAVVGPLGVGTQASALIAVAAGASAIRSFSWIASGTVLWCIVAGIAATTGIQLLSLS